MMYARLSKIILLSGVLVFRVSGSAVLGSADLLGHLSTRQTGLPDIPAQCQTSCNAVFAAFQNCPNPACLCTTNNARTLESCLDCVVGIDPSTEVVMSAQSILSAFSGSCQGTSVSSLSLSIGSSATAPVTSSILSSLPSRTSLNSDSTLALPTSTPTTPATSSSHVSQLTVISMSPSSTTTATSTSSSGGSVSPNSASSLSIAWNGFLGAGVGVVVGMMALIQCLEYLLSFNADTFSLDASAHTVRNSIHQIIESNVASFDRVWLLNLSKTIVRSRNSCSPVLDVRIPNTEVLKPEDDFTRKKFTERRAGIPSDRSTALRSKRYVTLIPCQSTCNVITTITSCFNCIVGFDPSTLIISTAQNSLDESNLACQGSPSVPFLTSVPKLSNTYDMSTTLLSHVSQVTITTVNGPMTSSGFCVSLEVDLTLL
ncbi:hypothetical protein E4T56_gene2828 [Termitomyces sp. T112]|nr:hypothetical protein E4T56_gene2828 [Termitomyces sp. T112]